ncbi:hypothetical protein FIU93_22560 [Labrenzia sp. THAF35]|uniref:hypothetical protein n=1 Tax=Labrenzia sp. THAF35 TaxID=2587854 RepID=UPI001268EC6F|nr:hypothetical protein [Labrenzia sp. THAF35]QFT69585.1 hypothetical protein FIU93_22560 [Labrenzia sp. THAF35]
MELADDHIMETFGPLTPERAGDYMQTFSGRKFWPLDPRSDEIHLEDVAHSLSMQCRYNGHCKRYYSVAEHAVHVGNWLLNNHDPVKAFYGLHHDDSEAYLADVPRPVKPWLRGYSALEKAVQACVWDYLGMPQYVPTVVKEADDRILSDERAQNMVYMEWDYEPGPALEIDLQFWHPEYAEQEFLMLHNRLALMLSL